MDRTRQRYRPKAAQIGRPSDNLQQANTFGHDTVIQISARGGAFLFRVPIGVRKRAANVPPDFNDDQGGISISKVLIVDAETLLKSTDRRKAAQTRASLSQNDHQESAAWSCQFRMPYSADFRKHSAAKASNPKPEQLNSEIARFEEKMLCNIAYPQLV